VALARRQSAQVGLPGLVSGLALPLFFVAFLNRDGPGEICSRHFAARVVIGEHCSEESSPWPWLACGIAMAIGGAFWFIVSRRDAREQSRG
jgi:hypothetical protein